MPTATAPFRFGLKSLFTVVTAVAVHLAVYSWNPDAFATLLPCSLLAAGMALVRRRTADWPAAVVFGAAFGAIGLVLTFGALMSATVYPEFTPSGFSFKRSGVTLSDYGQRGIAFSVVICSCLVLAYSVGLPLWRIVFRHR
jgi:hypothetical protein